MGKFIIENIVGLLLALALITQVIAPVFIKDLKFFWLFRPSKNDAETKI